MIRHIKKDQSELLVEYALLLLETGNKAIAKNQKFNLVLSGGSSPKVLFNLLSSEEYRNRIDWSKVFFFFGDERYVPTKDPDYNGQMAKEFLFNPLGILSSQIFLVNTDLTPDAAAANYQQRIRDHFSWEKIVFDFIMLGMGDDAHTASLFPETTILMNKEATVNAVLIKENVWRISMTAPLINQATCVAFLVFGANKAEALQHVWEGGKNTNLYPSQLIQPQKGELHWFVDEAAASLVAA